MHLAPLKSISRNQLLDYLWCDNYLRLGVLSDKKGLFGWDSCKREFALSVLTVKEALGCLLSNCLFDGQLIDLFDLKSGRTTR